ncbi:hypothetical protein FA15DRAFT_657741 [Coprinopsis marcescibilis]|uniref:Uncharacterized protein n=1 Tax=Coprinopsis marcescibilis TaxID=230819 RepID=A0A5C3KP94_COPMA|nr:hypothetical protein FA15DRAFT_657741 [Coprinopsis marcescibilis]
MDTKPVVARSLTPTCLKTLPPTVKDMVKAPAFLPPLFEESPANVKQINFDETVTLIASDAAHKEKHYGVQRNRRPTTCIPLPPLGHEAPVIHPILQSNPSSDFTWDIRFPACDLFADSVWLHQPATTPTASSFAIRCAAFERPIVVFPSDENITQHVLGPQSEERGHEDLVSIWSALALKHPGSIALWAREGKQAFRKPSCWRWELYVEWNISKSHRRRCVGTLTWINTQGVVCRQ